MTLADHEPWLIPYIPRHGNTAIDVGSAQGVWTEILASRFRKVIAIDPVQLPMNTMRYDNIYFLPKAAWSSGTKVELRSYGNLDQTSAVFRQGEYRGYDREISRNISPTVTIDSLNLEFVDFIKIDVEGAEIEVLKGASKTIGWNMPEIIIEVHRKEYLDEIRSLLSMYDVTKIPRPDGETYNSWIVCRHRPHEP